MKLTFTDKEFEKLPSGCDCNFIVRDGHGFKLYRDDKRRTRAFLNQRLFHAYGFGPACWQPFEITVDIPDRTYGEKSKVYYGYVTELVHIIHKESWQYMRRADGYGSVMSPFQVSVVQEINDLRRRIRDVGLDWGDTNYFNMGVTDDGRLVVVDFAECYMLPCAEDTLNFSLSKAA